MTDARRSRLTRALGAVVSGGFLVLGVVELAFRLDDPLVLLYWLPVLWGAAALVFLGVFRLDERRQLSVALVVVGVFLGLVASAWTLLMPVLGLALVGLTLAGLSHARPAAG